jgi:hypothetical protein
MSERWTPCPTIFSMRNLSLMVALVAVVTARLALPRSRTSPVRSSS